MTFTKEDAENDGLIKQEAGSEMTKQAKTHNPELYEYFVDVCNEVGRDPSNVFGEMVIKALESESYADKLLQSEISMMDLRANEIRMEDVKFVTDLADELGLHDDGGSKDPIDRLVERRIESVSSTPLSGISRKGGGGGEVSQELASHIESLHAKIDQMESKMGDDGDGGGGDDDSDTSGQNVGDLFSDDTGGDSGSSDLEVVRDDGGGSDTSMDEPVPDGDDNDESEGDSVEADEQEMIPPDIALRDEDGDGDGGSDDGDDGGVMSSEDAVVDE